MPGPPRPPPRPVEQQQAAGLAALRKPDVEPVGGTEIERHPQRRRDQDRERHELGTAHEHVAEGGQPDQPDEPERRAGGGEAR